MPSRLKNGRWYCSQCFWWLMRAGAQLFLMKMRNELMPAALLKETNLSFLMMWIYFLISCWEYFWLASLFFSWWWLRFDQLTVKLSINPPSSTTVVRILALRRVDTSRAAAIFFSLDYDLMEVSFHWMKILLSTSVDWGSTVPWVVREVFKTCRDDSLNKSWKIQTVRIKLKGGFKLPCE